MINTVFHAEAQGEYQAAFAWYAGNLLVYFDKREPLAIPNVTLDVLPRE